MKDWQAWFLVAHAWLIASLLTQNVAAFALGALHLMLAAVNAIRSRDELENKTEKT